VLDHQLGPRGILTILLHDLTVLFDISLQHGVEVAQLPEQLVKAVEIRVAEEGAKSGQLLSVVARRELGQTPVDVGGVGGRREERSRSDGGDSDRRDEGENRSGGDSDLGGDGATNGLLLLADGLAAADGLGGGGGGAGRSDVGGDGGSAGASHRSFGLGAGDDHLVGVDGVGGENVDVEDLEVKTEKCAKHKKVEKLVLVKTFERLEKLAFRTGEERKKKWLEGGERGYLWGEAQ
jgi:hypothetical protein